MGVMGERLGKKDWVVKGIEGLGIKTLGERLREKDWVKKGIEGVGKEWGDGGWGENGGVKDGVLGKEGEGWSSCGETGEEGLCYE